MEQLGSQPAVYDKGHPVAERGGIVHIVGGENDGFTPRLLFQDQVFHPPGVKRILVGGGFIEKQDLGIVDRSFNKVQAGFHAFGKLDTRLSASGSSPTRSSSSSMSRFFWYREEKKRRFSLAVSFS